MSYEQSLQFQKMEPRWKVLHRSAQKVLKQAQPSPRKDKFRSSKDKNQEPKTSQLFKDRSNKLLYYVNSYLEKQSPAHHVKTVKNNNGCSPSVLSTKRQQLNSQYFQHHQKKISFQQGDNENMPPEQPLNTITKLPSMIERSEKCKTTRSSRKTQIESIQNESVRLSLIKSQSQKISQEGFQLKISQSNGFEQYYLK